MIDIILLLLKYTSTPKVLITIVDINYNKPLHFLVILIVNYIF
jgi:hypothetical protein